ncbi:tRNA lysidine(34) synthetase TilS [Gemmobacter sp. 24YEA27]|uniref:tRNA lysidine(34) synthetase TilS n=1 Tax=Gemmobacter sp. 24YEA27 TaxID=3040672 RepID=UPI0024B33D7D|nr:tRNA lysidine(34) synthetase TilS [Gemmobacter sp. 24YEA27]
MPLSPQYRWLEQHEPADRGLLRSCLSFEFRQNAGASKIGVAVSGGGDSVALLHLVARAAPHWGLSAEAATVNHHLRPEAADEADFVSQVAAGLGLAHQTLDWTSHPATGNLMQAAGQARLDLLAAWAKSRGITDVLLGHTADDQAETFVMGLGRAAGLDGLTGMRARFDHNAVSFWRPLLGWSRAGMRAFLNRHDLAWCDDPTNEDDTYTRARIRKALPGLAPLGLTLSSLSETIRNLADVQDLLRHTTADAFARFGREEAGALHFAHLPFTDSPFELQRRLIIAAIRWISGTRHPPRADSVHQVLSELWRHRGTTLGGCLIRVGPQEIRVTREPRAVAGPLTWHPGATWDHRWQVTGPSLPDATLRALGADGLAQMPDWRKSGIRRDAALVSPALWQGDRLVSAPLFPQFAAKWQASLYPTFGSFILSH